MRRVKHIYLGVLGAWLLVCGGRALLPWVGNYQLVEYMDGHGVYISGVWNEKAGQQPAHIYAELNKRLEAAQPGTRFFFSPWMEGCEFICQGLIVSPIREGKAALSPEAKKVMLEWEEETGIFVWPAVQD